MKDQTPNDDSNNIDISFDGDSTAGNANESGGAPGSGAVTESGQNSAQQIEALKDQLLRKAAEFENFRRRTREEQSMLIKYGNEGLILELLPVLDDFARSLKAGREHPDFDVFFKGTELVRNKLVKVLESRGLKPIESAGQPFDEQLHDALLQIPREDVPAGTVIDEVETGYLLHERVIRHSKVTVAADPSA
jgi:molecular chaperone GrpE